MLTEDMVMSPLETVPENSAINTSDYPDASKDPLGTVPTKPKVIFLLIIFC